MLFADPEGFNAKRRKTAEQSYASFVTDVSRLPKTVFSFQGKLRCLCLCALQTLSEILFA